MKRVTLEPLDARPTVPLPASPGVADPLVDASRRARALEPMDPRVLGRVDVNAPRPKTTRWVVADPTPPDPKALEARVSALAAEVTAALKRASEPLPLEDEAETKPPPEPWPFPAAEEAAGGDQPRSSTSASSPGPIRFVERFPVLPPPGAEDENDEKKTRIGDARTAGLSYDESSKTWTREVFPTGPHTGPHTGTSVTSSIHAKHAHTSREDVYVLERWLDASVADADAFFFRRADDDLKNDDDADAATETRRERQKNENDATILSAPFTLAEIAETCDAAIDAFRATFETIALDVFTECRDRAALLRRVWAFNSTFFELRGAAKSAPARLAATREACEAQTSRARFKTENETLKLALAESTTRARRMERAHEKQLEKSKTQIFALTKKLRDAVCDSADARGASARACRRENALREELRDARVRFEKTKRAAHESAWRSIARRVVTRAREEEPRRAKIAVVIAEAVRADADVEASLRALVFETAESDVLERLESCRAWLVAENTKNTVLKKCVEELERDGARKECAAADAVAAALNEARDAREEAKRRRQARDDAFCMVRESRAEAESVRAALVETRRALGETRVEIDALRERMAVVSTRAESAESALAEARRTIDAAEAAATSREDALRRARAAAEARDAATARLIAEVSSVEDIVLDDSRIETKREEEDDDDDDDDLDDDVRVLVRSDVRLVSASNAAARLLRAFRNANDASLRERFALETRLAHVASDAKRSASAAAKFSAKLKECCSAREALDMKARALEHRLAKRDAELERARTETENIRRDAGILKRASDDAQDVAAALRARVEDRDASLLESTLTLKRSEEASIDALLVEFVLQAAYEDTQDDVKSMDASLRSTREAFRSERLATRRKEKKTNETLETTRRALRVARDARDVLAEEVVQLELTRRCVVDQRDEAARQARLYREETALARNALAREKEFAEREKAEREEKEAHEFTSRVEREFAFLSDLASDSASVASAARSEFGSTRALLLCAIASHRDARAFVRDARAEIEPATARTRDAARAKRSARLARAARRRDAATQSDDAHAACGKPVEASRQRYVIVNLP